MTERTDSVATAPADVPALQVTDLLKHYADADRNVFDGISFSVPKGKVLILSPESLYGLSTMSKTFEGLERMYRAGYAQAARIREFLDS